MMGRNDRLSSLNAAIDALGLARDATTTKSAQDAFGPAIFLLTTIKNSLINKPDCVELGLACAGAYQALARGTSGSQVDKHSQAVLEGIDQLTTAVTGIQKHIVNWGKRNPISQLFHLKDDEKVVATWKSELDRIRCDFEAKFTTSTDVNVPDVHLRTLNSRAAVTDDAPNTAVIAPKVRSDVLNTNVSVPASHHGAADSSPATSGIRYNITDVRTPIYHNALKNHKNTGGQNQGTHTSAPEDSLPPPPRAMPGPISDIRHDVQKIRAVISGVKGQVEEMNHTLKSLGGDNSQNLASQNSVTGESPPPPPRVFFGRDKLIEKTVGFAEHLTPIALLGAGGIGKTSVALTALHDNRIKDRFGDDRRFIRCDQFPGSLTHFLRRLSRAVGTTVENPHDLTPLRPMLSSKEMLIVLDNVESILDPQGPNSKEIYSVIEELSELRNICLLVTSRISIIPSNCKILQVPTLPVEAARETFYSIYKQVEQSDLANDILEKLDFHPLSITLLATVAHQNKWSIDRLTREWESRRTGVLQTAHNKSLAATIELSLASPMFQKLGSVARELLGVVAFFPQGVDEKNLDWFFPAIPNREDIFDKFCILSLAYRSEGFVKMLAPLRDYLSPKDPLSSPLFSMTRDGYLTRLSVPFDPERPDFGNARWVVSEDVNVEHLLDVLTSIDPCADNVWGACASFMDHLRWYKPRHIILGPKIERLPDDHPSKPECLYRLSTLLRLVGNCVENERLLAHALKLWRVRGDLDWVAVTLLNSSCISVSLTLEDQVQRAKEALEIFNKLENTAGQARCLAQLAELLRRNNQLDAAEETASRAIALLPENVGQLEACRCHHVLGSVDVSKGDREKAIDQFEVALGIASSHNWDEEAFRSHYSLASVFSQERRFDEAYTHLRRAKLRAVNNVFGLAQVMALQAEVWYNEGRFEEAASEVLRAADTFQKLGRAEDVEDCRQVLNTIRVAMGKPDLSDEPDSNGSHNRQPEEKSSSVHDSVIDGTSS